ncbi:glucan phosphoethanolaminetransferase (alkaline phosphatase superfamily) [Arcanobacterium wilhelmae]|uniref:Glucan phosphoethanolaminetransferase (Alkaline phosphatase superfamily) n=1 Tax=Arcanobacterium wilhelmae TaxID=1803177 RepID=A0ABT9NBI7_9ACTO|nr:hypothetical protein [Arcanobacterium wilhelmae]MDP9800865.1 glucan phosphoethanolaminetransferase (alkaline phosphatase superfamily) [Arcanobacterium wilhelmae]WFN90234.1 hypothetical protein P8A24_08630 [Arcanobacterium wilhelmae]
MFGKLLAQEWIDHKKTVVLGTLTVALVIVALSFPLQMLGIGVVSGMASGAAVGGAGAAVVATAVILAIGYWRTMRGPRAYFTFSVPARGREIFWAKVVFAYLVLVASILIVLLAVLSIMWHYGSKAGISFSQALAPLWNTLTAMGTGYFVAGLVLTLVVLFLDVAAVAALISITAQEKYQKFGVGGFVSALVVLYVASQVVSVVGMLAIPGVMNLESGSLSWGFMLPQFVEALRTGGQPNVLGLGFIPANFVLLGGVTWWGVRSIERHTSVQ